MKPTGRRRNTVAAKSVTRSLRAETVAYTPTWEVPVALKGVEWGAKAAKKLGAWLQSEGALAIQVRDSRPNGDEYYLEFCATNMTIHGIYVCSMRLTWPYDEALKLELCGSGFRPSLNTHSLTSYLVKSGESIVFSATFLTPSTSQRNAGLMKIGLGSAALEYWRLDEAESKTRDVTFAIRLDRKD